MTERANRDPAHGLTVHIITGESADTAAGGDPVLQPIDQEIDRNDPMQEATAGIDPNRMTEEREADSINAANLRQAQGLGGTWGMGAVNDGGVSSIQDVGSRSFANDAGDDAGQDNGPGSSQSSRPTYSTRDGKGSIEDFFKRG